MQREHQRERRDALMWTEMDVCIEVVHRLVMGLHQMAALCVITDSKIVGATSIADETPLM